MVKRRLSLWLPIAMGEVQRTELAPGYSISRVINGCWQLSPDHGGGPKTERETLRIFAELFDNGFTTFDCADIYAGVEETLGRFRKTLSNACEMQIHTKYAPDRATLSRLTDAQIDAAVDRSLRRLGVERLDLLQIHWWDYDVPGLDNLIHRLCRAQRAGKIRLLGATNFNTEQVRRIIDSGTDLVSLQSQYSLIDRRPETAMTPFCSQADIRLLPYGVLAGGFLSEKYLDSGPPSAMNRSLQKYRLIIDEIGGWHIYQDLLHRLLNISQRHGVSISTIAARWVMNQPSVAAIILGVGSRSRATHNRRLFDIALDDHDTEQLQARLSATNSPSGDMYDLERGAGGRHARIIKTNLHDEANAR